MEEIKFISSCHGSMKPLRKEQTDDSCSDSPERGSYQWVGAPCPAHSHFWHSYKFIVFLFSQTLLILYKYFDYLNVVGITIIFVNLWNKVTVILCISSNPLIVNIVNNWTPYTYYIFCTLLIWSKVSVLLCLEGLGLNRLGPNIAIDHSSGYQLTIHSKE